MTNEVWKKFNDILEVSSYGRVRTIERLVNGIGFGGSKTSKLIKSKLRKFQLSHNGYLQMRDRHELLRINRMVAIAFVPNPENKPHVNHKDCDKTNNHYTNLEWCTPLENNIHAISNGRTNPPKGRNHWKNKLDEMQVRTIRKCLIDGITQQKLADYFKVHRTCISAISLKYHWRHLL